MVTILPQSSHTSYLVPCDFYLFPKIKKFFSGCCDKSWKALDSEISQCLRGLLTSALCDAFQKWGKRLKPCISNSEENFEGMQCLFHYLCWGFIRLRQYIIHIKQQLYLLFKGTIIFKNRKFLLVWLKWSGTTEEVITGKRQCKIQSESLAWVFVSVMLIKPL